MFHLISYSVLVGHVLSYHLMYLSSFMIRPKDIHITKRNGNSVHIPLLEKISIIIQRLSHLNLYAKNIIAYDDIYIRYVNLSLIHVKHT